MKNEKKNPVGRPAGQKEETKKFAGMMIKKRLYNKTVPALYETRKRIEDENPKPEKKVK